MLGLPTVAVAPPSEDAQAELKRLQETADRLRKQQAIAQAAAQKDEKLKQQVELLQKQIEVQQKMITLLMEHMKKQAAAAPTVDKLETKVITLEARSKQAAQRDLELRARGGRGRRAPGRAGALRANAAVAAARALLAEQHQ